MLLEFLWSDVKLGTHHGQLKWNQMWIHEREGDTEEAKLLSLSPLLFQRSGAMSSELSRRNAATNGE